MKLPKARVKLHALPGASQIKTFKSKISFIYFLDFSKRFTKQFGNMIKMKFNST